MTLESNLFFNYFNKKYFELCIFGPVCKVIEKGNSAPWFQTYISDRSQTFSAGDSQIHSCYTAACPSLLHILKMSKNCFIDIKLAIAFL